MADSKSLSLKKLFQTARNIFARSNPVAGAVSNAYNAFTSNSPDNLNPVSKVGYGWSQAIKNPVTTATSFGKELVRPVAQFGTALGTAAAQPYVNKINQGTYNQSNALQDLYTKRAVQLQKSGGSAGFDRYMTASQDINQRMRNLANQGIATAQQGKADTIAGGVGTLETLLATSSPYALSGTAFGGALGAGMAPFSGQNPAEAVGTGAAQGFRLSGVTRFTNPAIDAVAGKLSSVVNPNTARIVGRVATGLGNVAEDRLIAKLNGYQQGLGDDVFSFALGVVMGGNADVKDWDNYKSNLKQQYGLTQEQIKEVDKTFKRARSRLSEDYRKGMGVRLSWQEPNGEAKSIITDKANQPGWIKYLIDRGIDYKISFPGGSLGAVGEPPKPPTDPTEALKTGKDLAADALRSVGQDPGDAYLSSSQLDQKYAIPREVVLRNEIDDINSRISKLSSNQNSQRPGSATQIALEKLFKQYTKKATELQDLVTNQAKGVAVNQVQPGKVQLKPRTKLLQEAEQLRNAGAEQLAANQELAQMNQANRSMFSDSQIKDINRLKQIARSNKALEGDVETLRKINPKLTDRVLEFMGELTGDSSLKNEEALLEKALSLPTQAETKVKTPQEILQARELERKAKQVTDLVFNSETDLQVKEKALATNQKAIEQSAKADYKEWERQLFKQESARRMTPNRLANRVATSIKESTIPSYAEQKAIAKTRDISNIGKGMTDIYRNVDRVFGKDSQVKKEILNPFDTAKAKMVDDLESEATGLETNIVKRFGFTKGGEESADIQRYGERLITKSDLVEKYGEKKADQIVIADRWFRQQYDRLLDEVNAVRKKIYPNSPDKLIPRRKNYYRHFQDLSDSLNGLKNLFETPAGIEPGLAGVSEYTKPKSKWLSFAQKRLGMKTEYDAVGGYLDYAGAQTYAKRIDPFIERFRTLRQELVDATSTEGNTNYGKLNNFIEFLDDYANDLAGKTNPADRLAQKYFGRKTFKFINWINSRVKANVIVGNLSSSIAQFFNIPQGVAEAGPVNSSKGIVRTLGSILDDSGSPIAQSEFVKTRYAGDISDRFDTGVFSNVKKAAAWITGIGDEIGTKFIWNSIYEKALSQGIDNPIKYADDMTRKMVAGRGIGEVPLLQKSKTFQLIAPFQLEVANIWHVMRDWAGEKAATKFVTFFVASYLMNRAAKEIRGSDVSLDPIQAGIEGIQAFNEEDDKKIGAMRAAGRVAGEILSNAPGGQTIAAIYPEFGTTIGDTKLPTRSDLFGEGDPTRFGGGLLSTKAITDPVFNLLPNYGGAQIKKTIQGLTTVNRGYSETPTGRVRFPVEKNVRNVVQAGVFGQYAMPEARQYFDQNTSSLGDKQSRAYKTILETQGVQAAQDFYNSILNKRGKSDVVPTGGETSTDLTVIQAKMDNSPQLLTPEEIATYYESKVTKPASTSEYQQKMYEKDIWSQVSNINQRDSLTQQQQDAAAIALLEKIGVSAEDYKYYTVAKQTNELKSLHAEEELTKLIATGASREEIYNWLVDNRREVNGNQVLTSGVIGDLVDKNIISYTDGQALKNLTVSGTGAKRSVTKKTSSKKPKIFKPTIKSIKAPRVKTTKAITFTPPKITRVRLKKPKKTLIRRIS